MAKKPCNFPNSLDNLVEDRKPGDVVTSDSYDVIESAINALERKVGINGSLDTNSHEYKIAHKANKPPSSTAGNLASLDSNGNLQDSGYKPTDFTTQDDISNKANKVLGAVNDNFVALKSDGDIKDSGKKAADFANVVHTHTGADIISEVSNADMVDGKHASEFEPVIPIKGTAFNKDFGTAEDTVCEGNDERLYDDRPPTPHAPTHITGGTDVIPDAVAGESSGLMSGADKQNLDDAVTKKHDHTNKALLDTYTQTEANIADAVDKKHNQNTDTYLDRGGTNEVSALTIKSTITDFTTHKNDTSNPHQVTAIQAGAAPTIHTHSGNDITSAVDEAKNAATVNSIYLRIAEGVLEYSLDGITYTPVEGAGGSSGDMYKIIYDVNDDGIVDKAEAIDDGTYSATAQDIEDAVTKKHSHSNLTLLETYNQPNTDIVDAVNKKHTQNTDQYLDQGGTNQVSAADVKDAVVKKHDHTNKALLDTYTQTEANLADAVSKKHSQNTDQYLDYGGTNQVSAADVKDAVTNSHKIYISTSDPSGGSDGEVWFKYTA